MSAGRAGPYAQALAHVEAGRHEQARVILTRLLASEPLRLEYLDLMRVVLGRLGQLPQALFYAQRAADAAPDHAGIVGELGMLCLRVGKNADAERAFWRALEIDPSFVDARCALLALLIGQDRHGEASAVAAAGLAIEPDHTELNMKAGAVEMETLRTREAFDRLAAMRFRHGGGQLGHDRLVEYQATLANYAGLYPEGSGEPLTPARISALHRESGGLLDAGAVPAPPRRARAADDRLRVAVLSPDLRRHPVGFFIEPLLRGAARHGVEVVALSTGPTDAVSERLRTHCAAWHDLSRAGGDELMRVMRESGCDVLLELAGLTISHLLPALSQRPAPVQATYLGYPNTTGCRFIDYRLVDAVTDPIGGQADSLCTESLVRIKPCFVCYPPPPEMPPAPHRAVGTGPVTFCCFNRLQKISRQTMQMWAEVLARVPDARLVLKDGPLKDAQTRRVVLDELARWGVDPSRVDLLAMTPGQDAHWEMMGRCDIALDPYPYHGTTTTCESLLMGTPVVSLAGPTHVARVGASILTHAGAAELITDSPQAYADLAVALATDRPWLADLHNTLPDRFRAGAICDQDRFAAAMTDALKAMAQGRA